MFVSKRVIGAHKVGLGANFAMEQILFCSTKEEISNKIDLGMNLTTEQTQIRTG